MKKDYESPVLKAVALLHQEPLLSMSGTISGYKQSGGGFSQEESSSAVREQVRHDLWDEDWSKQGNP